VDLEQLKDLIRLFEESSLHEIEIEEEGRRMSLKKHLPQQVVTHAVPMSGPPTFAPQLLAQPGQVAPIPGEPAAEVDETEGLPTINSPMVGTFYSSPSPGEPPFIHVDDIVEENQAVCIVEAMKLMNEVTAKFRAEIVKILVENGEPVEYGQPLFVVRPAEEV
jgi:acetyl-CoA carboxylase biotin carboxyl carrier protein